MASAPASRGNKKYKPAAASYKAVNTIFKEPIYKFLGKIKSQPFFKWPQPMKGDPSTRDQSKFCAYHKHNGHRTKDCKAFKAHLEKLIKDRHLRDYIKEEGRHNNRAQRRNDDDQDSDEPEGIINVIHLTLAPKGSNKARTEVKSASHQKQVMTAELEPDAKKAWIEMLKIWFSDKDLHGVHLPHNDPLVLTLKLKNLLV